MEVGADLRISSN